MRFLIGVLVLSTIAVSACSNKGRRIPIRKNTDNEVVQKDGKAVRSNDILGEGECLNLDIAKKFISDRKNSIVTLYSSDLDVGTYSIASEEGIRGFAALVPTSDISVAKSKLLLCGDQKPALIVKQGQDVVDGFKLLGTKQDKCLTVTDGSKVFDVINKAQSRLTLKRQDGLEIRDYAVRGGDRIEITKYTAGSTGIAGADWLKQTSVITWGDHEAMALTRKFATFLKDAVKTPAQFDALLVKPEQVQATGENKGKRKRVVSKGVAKAVAEDRSLIGVSGSMYSYIVNQINAGELKNACK